MNYKDLKIPACKNFSGYKPCFSYFNCLEEGCKQQNNSSNTGVKILIISLDALGNVLLNTSILKSLKSKYPESTIYWLTMKNAAPILQNSNYIDKVFPWDDENRMILRNIKFNVLLNSDKSAYACSFANEIISEEKYGFLLNEDGKIVPSNNFAMYNYKLGIDDNLKFRINNKSGSEIIHETFNLKFNRDGYEFNFNKEELDFTESYKKQINYSRKFNYIGINTGCSNLFPNKKMTVEQHTELINNLSRFEGLKIVILGGKEDTERNIKIYESLKPEVKINIIYTPTNLGLRSGACFMNICDLVITGDSFGMHLAIALKKYVIAWFGLSCWSEIDLFERGEKLIPEGLQCAPCWKKQCPYDLECIKMIDLNKISEIVRKLVIVKPYLKNFN